MLREHEELRIEAQAVVEIAERGAAARARRCARMGPLQLAQPVGDHFDLLEPSKFACMSQPLAEFMAAHDLVKPQGDPLTALKHLSTTLHDSFDYELGVTEVTFADRSTR